MIQGREQRESRQSYVALNHEIIAKWFTDKALEW